VCRVRFVPCGEWRHADGVVLAGVCRQLPAAGGGDAMVRGVPEVGAVYELWCPSSSPSNKA
jgi:hypothetical protein